jgi:hypothetical protein
VAYAGNLSGTTRPRTAHSDRACSHSPVTPWQ